MRRPITTQAARAVPLVGYTALAFALFANVWAAPASRWIGVDGDPDGTIWSIAWGAYSLVHHLNPFITDHIFFPSGTNVLWSNADAPMALSWLVAPVTLTLGPIVAYNLLQTLALALSAWTAYLAIRRFVTRPWAAALGGLVYGFGPYMLAAAYGHMALSFGVVPPLLVIVLDRLFVRRDLSPILAGLAAGVLEAFQLHVTQELVASEAIIVAVCAAWLAGLALVLRIPVPWADVVKRGIVAGGLAIAVFVVLTGFTLYTLFAGPARITHEPVRAFGTYVTDLLNPLIPPQTTHLVHTEWTIQVSRSFPGVPVESGGYLGVGLIGVLMFTALRWWRSPLVLFGAGCLALTLLISFGPHATYAGHHSLHVVLPWEVFRNVPVLNEVLNERIALYVDLFAGLLLALFLDRAWDSRLGLTRSASVVATAASLALLLPTIPLATSEAHVPSIFQPGTSANRYFHTLVPDGSSAVILPADSLEPGEGYSMLWQAVDGLRFKMPEGDLVHGDSDGVATLDPPPSPLWWSMSLIQRGSSPPPAYWAAVRSQLSRIGVRAVVVGAMPHRDVAIAYFNLLLGRAPVDTGDAMVWSTA